MWQFAPNSIYYVLSLWQRLVMSIPYVKASEPHMLETYTPEVSCLLSLTSVNLYQNVVLVLLAQYRVYRVRDFY